jgi:hypothetical protein
MKTKPAPAGSWGECPRCARADVEADPAIAAAIGELREVLAWLRRGERRQAGLLLCRIQGRLASALERIDGAEGLHSAQGNVRAGARSRGRVVRSLGVMKTNRKARSKKV